MAFLPGMGAPRGPVGWGISPKTSEYASFEEQAAELQRQKALADAIMQRGLFGGAPTEGKMVGGRWIAPDATQSIQNAFGVFAGNKMGQEASDSIGQVRQRQREAVNEWMKPLAEGVTEQKPFEAPYMEGEEAPLTGNTAVSQRPMKRGELLAHYLKGTELGGPAAAFSQAGLAKMLEQQYKTPKWTTEERYNPETGKSEKVWVDANLGPAGPEFPFGGQKGEGATDARKKMLELINLGVAPDFARKVAYGLIKQVTLPDGSIGWEDLEGREGAMAAPPGAPAPGAPAPGAAPAAPGAPAPASQYAPSPVPSNVRVISPGTKPAEKLSADVKELHKELTTKNVPDLIQAVNNVNTLLEELGIQRDPKTGEIAKNIPGVGSVEGLLPDWVAEKWDSKGGDLRGKLAAASNKILAAQSGLAVTTQENQRFLKQLQQGVGMSDEAMLRGWEGVLSELEAKVRGYRGGFDPTVVQKYEQEAGPLTINKPSFMGGSTGGATGGWKGGNGPSPTPAPKSSGKNRAADFF